MDNDYIMTLSRRKKIKIIQKGSENFLDILVHDTNWKIRLEVA